MSEERHTQAEHAEILDASPPACVCASAASDPRAKAKASERQGKARHLLYLGSDIDITPCRNQLLHRVRLSFLRRDEDRRGSILVDRARGVGWGGGGGERVWWIYIYILYTHTHNASQVFCSDILLVA